MFALTAFTASSAALAAPFFCADGTDDHSCDSAPAGRPASHPTSLPGPFGIGDLGPVAYRWVETLAAMKQTWWQILPLGPTGSGDSPYQSFSAFAGNVNLLSPELLERDGLVSRRLLGRTSTSPTTTSITTACTPFKTRYAAGRVGRVPRRQGRRT